MKKKLVSGASGKAQAKPKTVVTSARSGAKRTAPAAPTTLFGDLLTDLNKTKACGVLLTVYVVRFARTLKSISCGSHTIQVKKPCKDLRLNSFPREWPKLNGGLKEDLTILIRLGLLIMGRGSTRSTSLLRETCLGYIALRRERRRSKWEL